MCLAAIGTFRGILGQEICHLKSFYLNQFAKVGLIWAKLAKIIILCLIVILFGFNRPNTIRKQSYWAYVLKGVEIALFWSKMAFLGTENSGFEALFAFWMQIGFSKIIINGIFSNLGPPKRYQWHPNTWDNIIWGKFRKNRATEG